MNTHPVSTSVVPAGSVGANPSHEGLHPPVGREGGGGARRAWKTPMVEDVEKVQVGRFYMVPCVRIDCPFGMYPRTSLVPVQGDWHEDREIIGFHPEHFHPDWRFVNQQTVDYYLSNLYWGGEGKKDSERKRIRVPKRLAARVLSKVISPALIYRRLKCKRQHPTFPETAPWQKKLEDRYANAKARCDVCPHKAFSLKGAPVRNGARVCPGHGLAWSVKDGSLVRRAKA